MGPSRPIQRNLNINNPRLSFELSTLAYFRYLIKVFTLLVSVFALDTNKLSTESPCQPWHKQHSPHGHRCHGCRPCQRSHWSLSPCHRVSNVNPSINVSVYFAKDRRRIIISVLRPSTPWTFLWCLRGPANFLSPLSLRLLASSLPRWLIQLESFCPGEDWLAWWARGLSGQL